MVSYREMPAPGLLRDLAECVWVTNAAEPGRILPDGCMDLIAMNRAVVIAGPDTTAYISRQICGVATGIRFRPGALPRLLGVPASEFHGARIALDAVRPETAGRPLMEVTAQLLRGESRTETAPWSTSQLAHVTSRFAAGASVRSVADEIGWSARTLQRQCGVVYGYGPAMLRRILRFRRAVRLLRAGRSAADTAHAVGYADQSHLSRQVRALAGVSTSQLVSDANRSTEVPSGSSTVA